MRGVLKTFAKFTGKHMCQSLFLTMFKAEALAKVFYCEFWESFENTFVTEHVRAAIHNLRSDKVSRNKSVLSHNVILLSNRKNIVF